MAAETAHERHLRRAKESPRLAVKLRKRERAREIARMLMGEPEFAAVLFESEILGKPPTEPLTPAERAEARRQVFALARGLWDRGTQPSSPRTREEIEADAQQLSEELAKLRSKLD